MNKNKIEAENMHHLYTLNERVKLVKEAMPVYEEVFQASAKKRQQLVEDGRIDYYLRPMMGPRLELHLRGHVGVHEVIRQMDGIARYIDARSLSQEFPDISAITYTHLARAVERLTYMPPAIYTYAPAHMSEDA